MKESKKYDITVAGHICLDIIPDIPDTGIKNVAQLFAPGKLIRVNAAKLSTGGPVSNTGLALARLGFDVAFMARLGDDVFGSLILDLLQDQGGVKGLSVSADDRTSYTVAIAPPGIDRIFFHDPGANDNFSLENVNIEVVEQSKLFHFGYPPLMASCYRDEGAELERIFRAVKSAGATTSLDMALSLDGRRCDGGGSD